MHITRKELYKLRGKYPGLRPRDEFLWDEFVHRNRKAYRAVAYNVHIGDPVEDESKRGTMKANGMFDVSQWLVDVLAWTDEHVHVIEIKPDAGPGALGQALAYTRLLHSEGRVGENAVPVVLTNNVSPILKTAAGMLGVKIITP